jgi:hypothetical protein
MKTPIAWPRLAAGLALLALLGVALNVVNLRFTRTSPGGNDFLPRWVGTRMFLTQGDSPYSAATTAAIHDRMYGRAAEADEDQALFAYPFYSMLVFAPFALVPDYPLARALWITAQEMALAATVLAALALTGWRPGRWPLVAALVFAMVWFHSAKPLVDGNASILVTLFVTLGLWALRRGRDGTAGLLLALSTIKPQMAALLLLFTLSWALSQKCRGVVVSFVLSLLALVGISTALEPQWLAQNVLQLLAYTGYTPPGTLLGAFTQWWGDAGHAAGLLVSAALGLLLFYEWVNASQQPFDWFLWTACVTLVLSPLVGLPSTSSNHVILLPVIIWLLALWQRRTRQVHATWFFLPALFVGLWALFLVTLPQEQTQFREHLSLLLAAPLFLLLNLYWLRWWLLHRRGVAA